jgi:hypothetical protein
VNTALASGLCHYFRQIFVCDEDMSNGKALMRVAVDDGAVIYLNGVEIYRCNMPSGVISNSSYAVTNVLNPNFRVG